jgi:UDP-glucose 4-epimerase
MYLLFETIKQNKIVPSAQSWPAGRFDTNMHSLVTGGAGFIGSHLVDRLIEDGDRVTIIDNLATGRESNLSGALSSGRAELRVANVADLETIQPWFDGVDRVFHLAGLADIVPSIENPMDYHHANVDGTVGVIEATRQAGVRRFVYAASSSCYGIPDEYPTPETAPVRPEYPYALAKNLGEQIALHWGQVYGIQTISLRLFNVYGPRHRTSGAYGAVFGVFLAQRIAGKPLTIVGDGNQTRDFTYVTDVVDAFVKASTGSAIGEIMNVGSGGTYSVNMLADIIGGPTVNIPKRPGEPDSTFADTGKIRQTLGWQPQVSFEDGVARVLEVIEEWADAPVWTPESIAGATKVWFDNLDSRVGN